jgi:hypothetical protein
MDIASNLSYSRYRIWHWHCFKPIFSIQDIELAFYFWTAATPNAITADPMNYKVGDTLYTVAATDNEGDDLTFTCTIANSQVPYECESGNHCWNNRYFLFK